MCHKTEQYDMAGKLNPQQHVKALLGPILRAVLHALGHLAGVSWGGCAS